MSHGDNSSSANHVCVCARPRSRTKDKKRKRQTEKGRMKYWPAFTERKRSQKNKKTTKIICVCCVSYQPEIVKMSYFRFRHALVTIRRHRSRRWRGCGTTTPAINRQRRRTTTMHLNTLTCMFFFFYSLLSFAVNPIDGAFETLSVGRVSRTYL